MGVSWQNTGANLGLDMNSPRPYGEWAKEQIELVAKYTQKIATTLHSPFVEQGLPTSGKHDTAQQTL